MSGGLLNVHKLKLQNCSLEFIHEHAFTGLQLLIELDLSHNSIKQLESNVFRENIKLRIVYLSNNKLYELGSRVFHNMTHLQRIHLDNNELRTIGEDIFSFNCPITYLSLENNKLSYLAASFVTRLRKLISFDLAGNWWQCTCKLEPFRKLTLDNNWITKPIECYEPERLRGGKWSDPSVIFACESRIVEPGANAVFDVDTTNYTIGCKVEGEPRPTVVWITNARNIEAHRNPQKYHISSSLERPFWDNLTIFNVNYRDRGDYKCVATNAAGSDERNVTVLLHDSYFIGGGTLSITSISSAMLLVKLLAFGAVLLVVVIIMLICYCCKKRGRTTPDMDKHRPITHSHEFITLNVHSDGIEKSLLADVKTSRQYSVPVAVNSKCTEITQATLKLMGEDSILIPECNYNVKPECSVLTLKRRASDVYETQSDNLGLRTTTHAGSKDDAPRLHKLIPDVLSKAKVAHSMQCIELHVNHIRAADSRFARSPCYRDKQIADGKVEVRCGTEV